MENLHIVKGKTFERTSGGKKITMHYDRIPEKEGRYRGKIGKHFAFGFWEKPSQEQEQEKPIEKPDKKYSPPPEPKKPKKKNYE